MDVGRTDASLTAVKNEENEKLKKFKSRLVANGANLRGATGEKIEEDLAHVIPCSLTGIRTCLAYELLTDGSTYRGDVKGASGGSGHSLLVRGGAQQRRGGAQQF